MGILECVQFGDRTVHVLPVILMFSAGLVGRRRIISFNLLLRSSTVLRHDCHHP